LHKKLALFFVFAILDTTCEKTISYHLSSTHRRRVHGFRTRRSQNYDVRILHSQTKPGVLHLNANGAETMKSKSQELIPMIK